MSLFVPVSANAQVSVLFLGDSLTSGYGIAKDDAYPALVKRLADDDGIEITVVNAGLSGDTSAGALRRVSLYLKQPIDILFLAIGANDGLRGLDINAMESNIKSTIAAFKQANPDSSVVLAGIEAPPNMGAKYVSAFRTVFPRLAQEQGATLMPFLLDGVAAHSELNLADRMHPNERGHKLMAEQVWKLLKPVVQEKSQSDS